MPQVLDYSSGPPSAAAVKAHGFAGAVRYLSWLPNPKCLSPAETQDFFANGLLLALVWEVGANPLGSDPAAAGREAARQAAIDGFPTTVPIYVAFDYDMPESDWAAAAGWGDAFAAAAGHPWRGYMKGVAGDRLVADGHFPSFWEPYAWSTFPGGGSSAGYVSPHACLFQRLAGVTVGGVACDINDVLLAGWGGWAPDLAPPVPTTVTTGASTGDKVTPHQVTGCATDGFGNGWVQLPGVAAATVVSVAFNGVVPETAGSYTDPALWDKDDVAGKAQINIYNHGVRNGAVDFTVWTSP